MTEREAAMAVGFARRVGPATASRLLDRFGSYLRIVEVVAREETGGECVPEPVADGIRRSVAERVWKRELELAARADARFAVPGDDDYPDALAEIARPPVGVFVAGETLGDLAPMVGIVGTRTPTPRGSAVATQLAADLARAGLTVVSGLARGIDTRAHEGALEAGGRTVAVLGCGLSCVYPPENAGLALSVRSGGALVSEFPMLDEPIAGYFPRRNRVISGLSVGVVVVEAAARSGALITAASALEEGREVFAVPGPVDEPLSVGTNRLIKAGARLVEDAGDVLDELELAWGPFPVARPGWSVAAGQDAASGPPGGTEEVPTEPPEGSTGRSAGSTPARLLELLSLTPVSVDELVAATGVPVAAVLSGLLRLELSGDAERTPGGRFVLGTRGRSRRSARVR